MEYRNNIFLDDERHPWDVTWGEFDYTKESWTVIRSYEAFIKAIMEYFPEKISFDNDLQTEKEGYDCLKWLINYVIENNLSLPKIYIHSQNTVAIENMKSYLASFKKVNEKK